MFDALIHRPPVRRWSTLFLIGSLALHAAAALGILVWAMWRIELLVPERQPVEIAIPYRVAAVAPDPGPAPAARPPVAKPPRTAVKEPTQPTTRIEELVPAVAGPAIDGATSTDDTGGGGGGGENTTGAVCADPPCEIGEPARLPPPVCGDGIRAAVEACDDGNTRDGDGCSRACRVEARTVVAPPQVIESLRTSGEARILPPSSVQSQMQREGKARVAAAFRVCLDTAGRVSSVSRLSSTGYADYDERLSSGVREWRYRPYQVDGRAVAVCGVVQFVYVQR
jgi:cysteine-rich repeat protein